MNISRSFNGQNINTSLRENLLKIHKSHILHRLKLLYLVITNILIEDLKAQYAPFSFLYEVNALFENRLIFNPGFESDRCKVLSLKLSKYTI